MLMVGAGLLLHSFWNLGRLDPGFNPRNVLVANIWLPAPNDPSQAYYRNPANRQISCARCCGACALFREWRLPEWEQPTVHR